MNPIQVLDKNTIDQIAAGEVIEKPASVVKELVENAIDARSSSITVEIKDGGCSLIRITDNGSGIEKEDIKTAFLRHATSKIRNAADLQHIHSLGFRGEALSSIASISKVELISKTPRAFLGVRYLIEGGEEVLSEEIGAPDGTTFLVRNLFYNTPARAKFLKSFTTEAGYIGTFIEQLALSHPEISFHYIVNGKNKLHTSGNGSLKDVIYQIYGRDITGQLQEVSFEKYEFSVTGFIGKPVIARGNRAFENYYVNGRYVKSKVITRAIEDAYRPFMMQHKYPFTTLFIEVEPEEVDINVHPTKMEVRFLNQDRIYHTIYQAISESLSKKELIPEIDFSQGLERKKEVSEEKNPLKNAKESREPAKETAAGPLKDRTRSAEDNVFIHMGQEQKSQEVPLKEGGQSKEAFLKEEKENEKVSLEEDREKKEVPLKEAAAREAQKFPEPFEKEASYALKKKEDTKEENLLKETIIYGGQENLFQEKLLSEQARHHHHIIGQVFKTYWLVEYDDKLFMIDQHAAHEKVLFERIRKEILNHEVTSQQLCPPMLVSLTLQQSSLLSAYKENFERLGFEINDFGGREYAVSAIPASLSGLSKGSLFIEMLDSLDETFSDKDPRDVVYDKMASMACKAAVKGNQSLSEKEVKALLNELLTLENPYCCPHGRPTIVSMSKYELEKKFKRIV